MSDNNTKFNKGAMNNMSAKYIDLKINGRLFPSWVLANFKDSKLPEIMQTEEDPCNIRQTKFNLKKYQEFLSKYLDYRSPYHDILIYHGLGSGKTRTAINIYNVLYNYTPGWNVFILLKAALKTSTWIPELERWLTKGEQEFRMKNIIFIHYDAPNADKKFFESVRESDSSKKSMYIIDEAHNFISNVYSNISSDKGKRAQHIYEHILQDKKENQSTRVILLSGTPAINKPYELALMFNLLRPGSFPKSENEFNHLYVSNASYRSMNPTYKNMFQRRIMGLVSYYIGATPDLYATKTYHYIDVQMSTYHQDIYTYFEEIEAAMAKRAKMKKGSGKSETYKSYTRQSANFVFPFISQRITGEGRPRPNKFRITEKEASIVMEAKDKSKLKLEKGTDKYMNVSKYTQALNEYITSFSQHLNEIGKKDSSEGYTLDDDIKLFIEKHQDDVDGFVALKKHSKLFIELHKCSAKLIYMILNILTSTGPVLVYSNYVMMEGLEIFKVYLKYFSFDHFKNGSAKHHYAEYHGGIKSQDERRAVLVEFNKKDNIKGDKVKIIMISPAGSEGLSLRNVRQVHIMEPYWHEVRITQMIGRAIRYLSHCDLPKKDRHVEIFRYKSVRADGEKWTTDQYIEDIARTKNSLLQSFLDAMKEVAIDCVLNMAHNMMEHEYKCFQFDEQTLFDKQIGPAYKRDIYDDMKVNNGSNSQDSDVVKIKVMKIKAVVQKTPGDNPTYSKPEFYWYYSESGVVYDYVLKFPLGKVSADENGIPNKLDTETYIIDQLVPIPLINGK
jgi:superfamily II DNA or RNA helicase